MAREVNDGLAAEYDRRNSNGEGYAVGEEADDINEIKGLGTLLDYDEHRGLALYAGTGGGAILVSGDYLGQQPWAVTLAAEGDR